MGLLRKLKLRGFSSLGASLLCRLVAFAVAQTNCPEDSTTTFEKIVGYKPSHSRLAPMYGLSEDNNSGTTADCIKRCQQSNECMGVMVNYDRNICFAASFVSANRREKLLPASDRANYFEKMCVRGPVCERAFVMERVVGKELSGFDNRVLGGVQYRKHCEELCLHEQAFPCRSGEYDASIQECRLSTEDRRSQPSSFRPAGNVEYFENQCVSHGPNGCDYEQRKDVDIFRADQVRAAFSSEQCRSLCDDCKEFLCRSFSFFPPAALCALSSDDTLSVGGSALRARQGVTFHQKANCLDLRLHCDEEAMVLTLNTLEPFEGRIYSKVDNPPPGDCEVAGRGDRSTTLAMSLRSRRCGVDTEEDGVFTSTIVIQHHPLIQQKGDRVIKLFCSFDAVNKTVTNTYKVLMGAQSVQAGTVNATAPSPNIRLRITDRNGADIIGAKLGDELYLRIEIDDDSVFGIYARDLVATSGRNDDSITLLDNSGCPIDHSIFPSLKRIARGKALIGKFEAFKFAGDTVVRFQVTVQFCLHECPLTTCSQRSPGKGPLHDIHSLSDRGVRDRDHPREHNFRDLPGFPRLSERSAVTRTKRAHSAPSIMRMLPTPSPTGAPSPSPTPSMMADLPLQREIIVEGIVPPGRSPDDVAIVPTTGNKVKSAVFDAHMLCAPHTMVTACLAVALVAQLLIIATCVSCVTLARRPHVQPPAASSRSDHSESPVMRHQHSQAYEAYEPSRRSRMRDYETSWGMARMHAHR
ncbi:uncharacterized protein LOC111245612 [Varroa destructor]|uniref:Uncharacterized protein n=1 Tax=Varroa destructor TaxID=109461 RepID=A0A7M7MBI7_VARDE|nr:uncharacterized protein LOC111245612 [Varroa destructor]